MTRDIKATVEELERLEREASPAPWVLSLCPKHEREGTTTSCLTHRTLVGTTVLGDRSNTPNGKLSAAARNALPSLLAELRRCWAIEEAAVSLREASEAYQELKLSADMAAVNYAHRRNAEAREDLFAALPPRKPSGGEEAR